MSEIVSNKNIRANGRDSEIAVIGAGNMGRALARRLAAGGNLVLLTNRDSEKARRVAEEISALAPGRIEVLSNQQAASRAQVVILATAYRESTRIAVELSDLLRGKIVVDISNPLNATYDDLVTDPTTSAGEEIQRRLAGCGVVKAFNTNFAGPLFEGHIDGQPLDVFLASDDSAAKAQVDSIVRSCGLRPLDAGPLINARTLDALSSSVSVCKAGMAFNFSRDSVFCRWTSIRRHPKFDRLTSSTTRRRLDQSRIGSRVSVPQYSDSSAESNCSPPLLSMRPKLWLASSRRLQVALSGHLNRLREKPTRNKSAC